MKDRATILQQVIKIIAMELDRPMDEIDEASDLTMDLEIDDAVRGEIVMGLEEEFGCELPDTSTEAVEKVGDFADLVVRGLAGDLKKPTPSIPSVMPSFKPLTNNEIAQGEGSELRRMIEPLNLSNPYKAYIEGRALLEAGFSDRLGILLLMDHALSIIGRDLEEHGDANLQTHYGGGKHTADDFFKWGDEIRKSIEAELHKGAVSPSYGNRR